MPHDDFEMSARSSMTPSENCFPVTPSDSEDLPHLTKAIYIGTGGDVVVLVGTSQVPVTFRNTIGGSILDVRVRAVKDTGTTASDLVGLA